MASAARPPGSKSSGAWLLDSSRVHLGQLEQRWWAAFSSLAKSILNAMACGPRHSVPPSLLCLGDLTLHSAGRRSGLAGPSWRHRPPVSRPLATNSRWQRRVAQL